MKPNNDTIRDNAKNMIRETYIVDPDGDSAIFTAEDMQAAYHTGFDDGYKEGGSDETGS